MSKNPTRGFQYLNGNYVYYQRLRTDGYYPQLADRVNFRQLARVKRASNLERIAQFFQNAANAEAKKETELLTKKFGRDISGSYENTNFGKELVTAINECLGIKKIFERNLALIQESRGQKNVMSFFPTYFQKAWEAHSDDIFQEAAKEFLQTDGTISGEVLAEVVEKNLPTLVREAVQAMFGAKVESGIKEGRDNYADAYREMSEALEKNSNGSNEFIQSFIDNYKLKNFVEAIRKSVQDIISFKGSITNDFNIKSQMAQRGGLTMEEVRTFAFNIVGEGLREAHGSDSVKVSLEGITSGRTKMKADSIATVDIPIDIISNWIQNNVFGTREKDTAAIVKLQEQLKSFNDGFITYVNAKNYSLNDNFREGKVHSDGTVQLPGFSAGSMISLENFEAAADNLSINYRTLINLCLQLIPNAIGSNEKTINNTKIALTEAIASALFDDFNVVGVVETDGAKSVHLLDLNGVLMPISFYFNLLYIAFDNAANHNLEDLIHVEIETPDNILYPNKTSEERKGGSKERWEEQSDDAMTRIRIGYHFLAAFREIMQTFR